MAVLLVGRKPKPVSVVAASLSEDKTSMVALGFGARRFWFRSVGGGVPSSLLLMLLLLFKSCVTFFFLLFLEGRAVSLLDGVCFECPRAFSSVENPKNFVVSARVLNFLWCQLGPFVALRHSSHDVVSNSGSSPLFRTA
jgi:hypothetical protein